VKTEKLFEKLLVVPVHRSYVPVEYYIFP